MTEMTRADAPGALPLLDRIDSSRDVKRLAPEELPRLADELRAFLLATV